EVEGSKFWFPNKKDQIVSHFKKCAYFFTETTPEEREKIFNLVKVLSK
ncbi:25324_t:CDS:1, partial [Racocetra persica]